MQDVLAGRVKVTFAGVPNVINHVRNGRLRALGVTGAKRWPDLPDVPTIAESGVPGYEAGSWLYLLAPTSTPRSAISALSTATGRIVAMPEVRERLLKIGSEPVFSPPEVLAKRIDTAVEQFATIARALALKPQ